jgi:hypothetical protein
MGKIFALFPRAIAARFQFQTLVYLLEEDPVQQCKAEIAAGLEAEGISD